MSELDHNRRDLLAAMAGVAVGSALGGHAAIGQASAARGYHLGAADGETVVRPSGDIVIKVDPQDPNVPTTLLSARGKATDICAALS